MTTSQVHRRRRVRLTHLAIAAAVAGAASMFGPRAGWAESTGDYRIGSLSDLSGPIAPISRPATAGFRAYFAAANAKGGINGRKVTLEVRDMKSDAQAARTQFGALASNGALAIVGPDLSTIYIAVAPLAAAAKVPLLSQGTPLDLLVPDAPYYLTSIPLVYCARIAVGVIAARAKAAGGAAPKIAALYSNSALTATWRDALIQQVKSIFGNELAAAEQLDASAINVTSPVSKIIAAKPDYVLVRILPTQVPLAVRALRDKGFTGPIIADFNGADTTVLKSVDDPDYMAIRAFADPTDTADPAVQKMLQDAKIAGVERDATSVFFTYGYVSAAIIAQALEGCGGACDGPAFNKTLAALQPKAIAGLSGPLGYDNDDHRLVHFGRIYKWDGEKGVAVPMTDWINGAH